MSTLLLDTLLLYCSCQYFNPCFCSPQTTVHNRLIFSKSVYARTGKIQRSVEEQQLFCQQWLSLMVTTKGWTAQENTIVSFIWFLPYTIFSFLPRKDLQNSDSLFQINARPFSTKMLYTIQLLLFSTSTLIFLLKRNYSYTMYTNIPSTTDFLKSVILYNCFQSNQIQYLKSADSLQRNMTHEKVLRIEAFTEGMDTDTLNV